MDTKYTERARNVIENAMSNAMVNSNTQIEPEHLLYSILDTKTLLNNAYSSEDLLALKKKVNKLIGGFGKISSTQQPQVSTALASVLNEASRRAVNSFVSIPLLILALILQERICKLFDDSEKIRKMLEAEIKNNKYDSENSDDPSESMEKFAVEVVELARQHKLDPVIGRENEIRQIIEILSKKTKSNAIMVGKPGVGKTAIINGLAQLIANDECKTLEGFKIYNVDMPAIVSGSKYRGDFEEKFKGIIKEAVKNKKTILFIDELHMILGAGETGGSMDAANILKPALADGSIKVIGATTYDEYRKYVLKDPAFERRFVRVDVQEPNCEDTITILRGLKERFELHHGVKIADKALVYAAKMGKRYIANRRMPDLAIELIDIACASSVINLNSEPAAIRNLKNKLWSLELEKTSIEIDLKTDSTVADAFNAVERKLSECRAELKIQEDAFNKDASHMAQARVIRKKIEDARIRCENAKKENDRYTVYDIQNNVLPMYEKELANIEKNDVIVSIDQVAQSLSRLTGIPIYKLSTKENEKLLNMSERIKSKLFGQNDAVDTVVSSIMAAKAGLQNENKPLASFLFIGPSGVGKTELSKIVCSELNDTTDHMVCLDMSDYVSEISVNKLIGAPAGYVGCEDGGTLTEPIKEMPYNFVLLDEINLAHQSCVNILYQLLDEGRVTDGRGVKVNFKNTVVAMTTNLGQEYITPGYIDKENIEKILISRFGQALINRIDNVVVFNHLDRNALRDIFVREMVELNKKLIEKNMKFSVSEAVIDYAVGISMNSNFGARILKRFAKDNFISELSRLLLTKKNEDFINVMCYLNEEKMDGIVCGNYTFLIN